MEKSRQRTDKNLRDNDTEFFFFSSFSREKSYVKESHDGNRGDLSMRWKQRSGQKTKRSGERHSFVRLFFPLSKHRSYLKRTKYRSNIWPDNDVPRENLPDLFIVRRGISWNNERERKSLGNCYDKRVIPPMSPLAIKPFRTKWGVK